RETIPIPVRNVGGDGRKNPGGENETNLSGKTRNARLGEKENGEKCLDYLGYEFDPESSGKIELAFRMIDQHPGRSRGHLLLGLFHSFRFLLSGRTGSEAWTGKDIEADRVTEVGFHRVGHGIFVWNLANAHFADRQQVVRDEAPDKHDNATQN